MKQTPGIATGRSEAAGREAPPGGCDRTTALARFWAVAAARANQLPPVRATAADVAGIGRLAQLDEALATLRVGDADLARAVMDGGPCVFAIARTLYDARQRMSAVHRAPANASTVPTGVRTRVPHLATAAERLRGDGGMLVRMPSDFALARARCDADSAVLHVLRAAGDGDRRAVWALLTAQPFGLDPAEAAVVAGMGLADAAANAAPRGVRDGGRAREVAAVVREAIAAIRSTTGRLHGMRTAVTHAARLCRTDRTATQLVAWADLADALWRDVDELRLPMTARLVLFARACEERIWSGLPCVVEGAAPLPESAGLSFEDRCAPGGDLALIAESLGVDEDELAAAYAGRLTVCVAASIAEATADAACAQEAVLRRRSWPVAEEGQTLVAPAMTFSASRLNTYAQCPRRWFYEYLCDVLEDPGSPAAAYGQAVHAALEAVHRAVRIPSQHAAADILMRLEREIEDAFAQRRDAFPTPLEYAVAVAKARRMAAQYVRWLAAETARRPVEIVGVEVLQRCRFGDHEFVGYIDRIDRPLAGGPTCIYDYKTGRIGGDAAAYLERVRNGAEAQLPLYYAMRTAAGERVGRVALVSLREPKDDVWLLALDVVPDGEEHTPAVEGVVSVRCEARDLEAALDALLATCDQLTKRGCDHFPAGADPPCGHCPYNRACREKPIDRERIFAR